MRKHSYVIFGLLLALTLLCGCKKGNHDTVVLFGDESYVKPIDVIYPKNYRNEWKTIAPGNDTVYDGVIPPDLTGEYLITGRFAGGNEWIHQYDSDIPYPYDSDPSVLNKYIYFRVKDQKNGIAKLYLCMYNNPNGYKAEFMVDTAYIFGDGAKNEFTLCFDTHEKPGNTGVEYFYGIIITGVIHHPDENDDRDGIANVKRWSVIKRRKEGSSTPSYYWLVGGQRLYVDKENFAERVDYGWGFDNE